MIHLEYDPPTAGVRVSFVVRDNETSSTPSSIRQALCEQGKRDGDKWLVSQNIETLEIIKTLLEKACNDTKCSR